MYFYIYTNIYVYLYMYIYIYIYVYIYIYIYCHDTHMTESCHMNDVVMCVLMNELLRTYEKIMPHT